MEKELEPQASGAGWNVSSPLLEKLVLASTSPRRAEILRIVGWPFEASAIDVDESRRSSEDAVTYVERLARAKAEAAAHHHPSAVVLGADTVVVVDGRILGKPRDQLEAQDMLRLLSGRWHEVLTGVAVMRTGEKARHLIAHETTRVHFAQMSDEEINWYVATGEPMDKAGAYAIQGRAALFIKEIEGDYWNIVGLPVRLAYELACEMKNRPEE